MLFSFLNLILCSDFMKKIEIINCSKYLDHFPTSAELNKEITPPLNSIIYVKRYSESGPFFYFKQSNQNGSVGSMEVLSSKSLHQDLYAQLIKKERDASLNHKELETKFNNHFSISIMGTEGNLRFKIAVIPLKQTPSAVKKTENLQQKSPEKRKKELEDQKQARALFFDQQKPTSTSLTLTEMYDDHFELKLTN